ncbi:MAG TPA: hypothetical protein VMH85_12000 [Terriglobales bacterium]|nr:hypothetical protein [Terriglobales bacterium]
MKRTPEDEQFGQDFAQRLRPFYERAIASGETEQAFARRLGVNRGGLQKYLSKHATPSLRTLVYAYREFQITIPYAGMETSPLVARTGKKRRQASQLQMNLPLTIEAPHGEIDVTVKKKSAHRYKLQLRIRRIG